MQPLIAPGQSWDALRAGFRWPRPARFNLAEACCDAWARLAPGRVALRQVQPDGKLRDWSYGELARGSRRLASVLAAYGVGGGDRVAVLLPQGPEAALTHLAAYRLGAIVVPLFTLFGEDGLRFRLADAGARALVTDADNLAKVLAIREELPKLAAVLSNGGGHGALDLWAEIDRAVETTAPMPGDPEAPALICYTSGTTGPPKGALHAHRVLIGHLPGIELAHDRLGRPGDCLWTPADWAWMGGLTNVLLPGLCLGVPVVAWRSTPFDPERAVEVIRAAAVRNLFVPPTALKLMRQSGVRSVPGLRSVASAGEALGEGLLEWGRQVLNTEINEFYGQTECNVVLGNSAALMPVRPGSAGRAIPGHDVAILTETGDVAAPGVAGEIAVRRPDPVMFLGYWRNPTKTDEKFRGDWLLTGDEATMDEAGHVFFRARADDVITSSGYRVGPGEVEECLTAHSDVAMAAAVGVPDPIRSEVVRVFVVAAPGVSTEGLAEALIDRVRTRLAPHLAPREVVFVETLPLTATGKIQRRALRER